MPYMNPVPVGRQAMDPVALLLAELQARGVIPGNPGPINPNAGFDIPEMPWQPPPTLAGQANPGGIRPALERQVPGRDPTQGAREALAAKMPSRELEALRGRESQRLITAAEGRPAVEPSNVPIDDGTAADLSPPGAPPKSSGRYKVWTNPTTGVPMIIREDSRDEPRPFHPIDRKNAGAVVPNAIASGSQTPTVDGGAGAPDEAMPNRKPTGRRVSIAPNGAPMPPPSAPATASAPQTLLDAAGAPMPPPPAPAPESGLGSFLRSEKGQDLADWLLTMGLGTMAAGGRPGATMAGSLGEGGLAANQLLQATQDRRDNRAVRREGAQLNAEVRRDQIEANRLAAADRVAANRENAQLRADTARENANLHANTRMAVAGIAAAARGDGSEKADRVQARIDKDASDYLDRAMKPPNNAPLDWKPPSEATIKAEVVRRFPRSTVARTYQTEDLDAQLDDALGRIRGANLPPDQAKAREQEARRRYEAARKRIIGE